MITLWQLVLLILMAILVGAIVPVLVQMRRTLKSAEVFIDDAGPRLRRTLDGVDQVTGRLNRIGDGAERSVSRLTPMIEALTTAADTVTRARGRFRSLWAVGAALGPALAAGARALFSPGGEEAAVTAPAAGSAADSRGREARGAKSPEAASRPGAPMTDIEFPGRSEREAE